MVKPYYKYLHTLSLDEVEYLFYKEFSTHKDKDKIYDAYAFAKASHKNQLRSTGGDLYVIHLARIALAMIVSWKIKDTNLIIAGILHDVVEDTTVKLEEITNKWSQDVATLVNSVTNPPNDEDDPQLKFKIREDKLAKLSKLPRRNRELWFFDSLDNMEDWHLVKPNSDLFKKTSRWMTQAKEIYLVSAKTLGKKYYRALSKVYSDNLKLGLKPQPNADFIA